MVILVAGQFSSCQRKHSSGKEEAVQEDSVAKQMLQGIWVDEDGQDVAFNLWRHIGITWCKRYQISHFKAD